MFEIWKRVILGFIERHIPASSNGSTETESTGEEACLQLSALPHPNRPPLLWSGRCLPMLLLLTLFSTIFYSLFLPPLTALAAILMKAQGNHSFLEMCLGTLPRVLAAALLTLAIGLAVLIPLLILRKCNFKWLIKTSEDNNSSGPSGSSAEDIPAAQWFWLSPSDAVAELFFYLDSTLLFMLLLCGDKRFEFLPLSTDLFRDLSTGITVSLVLAPLFLFRICSIGFLQIRGKGFGVVLPFQKCFIPLTAIQNISASPSKGIIRIARSEGREIVIHETLTGSKLFKGAISLMKNLTASENSPDRS